jgi:ribose 5-phosphate isomerase A
VDAEFSILAAKALTYVQDGARIGLGSGRTVEAFLPTLGEWVRQGRRIRGVPTSEGTAALARKVGIPLDTLDPDEPLDVTIDGADEVETHSLNLLKGWGGALVRERIVAAASRRQIILVTHEKLVDRLGTRGKLPVEVIPFAAPFCRRSIEHIGPAGTLRPVLRTVAGKPFLSDNSNWIFDCAVGPIADPTSLEQSLLAIPGVVDTGLFLGTAALVLVAEGQTVRELKKATDQHG